MKPTRLGEVDLAKGTAVHALIAVRALMVFGRVDVQCSWLGKAIFLISELAGVFVLVSRAALEVACGDVAVPRAAHL